MTIPRIKLGSVPWQGTIPPLAQKVILIRRRGQLKVWGVDVDPGVWGVPKHEQPDRRPLPSQALHNIALRSGVRTTFDLST